MYRTVMVPLDGSAFAEQALPVAAAVAERAGATIDLAHVAGHDLLHRDDSRRGHAYLEGVAARLRRRAGLSVSATLLEGAVAPALAAHALATGADLVAMTTHGRGALLRATLGGVADQLVRSLPLPVLLTRPRDGEEAWGAEAEADLRALGHVLLPLDGSALGEAAVEPAAELGALFGASYTLLQAIDPPMLGYALTAHADGVDQGALAELRAESLGYLEVVAARLRRRHLEVRCDTAPGYPPVAILAYAREHGASLIAVATHGQGGITRLLAGSTADAVMRGAPAPVLVCRPPAAIVPLHIGGGEAPREI